MYILHICKTSRGHGAEKRDRLLDMVRTDKVLPYYTLCRPIIWNGMAEMNSESCLP